MADNLTRRTKKQKPGHLTPHTAALENTDVSSRSKPFEHRFFFPSLGVTKRGVDLPSAIKAKSNVSDKQESGDGE